LVEQLVEQLVWQLGQLKEQHLVGLVEQLGLQKDLELVQPLVF